MNVLENIPYAEEGMGRRVLANEDYLLMMQVALKPGDRVPQHNADSHVRLLVLEGAIVVNLDGKDHTASRGTLLPVACKTPMNIRNESERNATFVILKTPHPKTLKKSECCPVSGKKE